MNKQERLERYNELSRRGCQREWGDIIVDLEESCDRLHKRLAKAKEMSSRKLIREVADVLESVMSTDPEMPSHEGTMQDAERTLAKLRELVK